MSTCRGTFVDRCGILRSSIDFFVAAERMFESAVSSVGERGLTGAEKVPANGIYCVHTRVLAPARRLPNTARTHARIPLLALPTSFTRRSTRRQCYSRQAPSPASRPLSGGGTHPTPAPPTFSPSTLNRRKLSREKEPSLTCYIYVGILDVNSISESRNTLSGVSSAFLYVRFFSFITT